MKAIIQLQLTRCHNLGAGSHIVITATLQIACIIVVQRKRCALEQVYFRIRSHIEFSIREIAVTLDVKGTANGLRTIPISPDIEFTLPGLVNVIIDTGSILGQFLDTVRHGCQELSGSSIRGEIIRRLYCACHTCTSCLV